MSVRVYIESAFNKRILKRANELIADENPTEANFTNAKDEDFDLELSIIKNFRNEKKEQV